MGSHPELPCNLSLASVPLWPLAGAVYSHYGYTETRWFSMSLMVEGWFVSQRYLRFLAAYWFMVDLGGTPKKASESGARNPLLEI